MESFLRLMKINNGYLVVARDSEVAMNLLWQVLNERLS